MFRYSALKMLLKSNAFIIAPIQLEGCGALQLKAPSFPPMLWLMAGACNLGTHGQLSLLRTPPHLQYTWNWNSLSLGVGSGSLFLLANIKNTYTNIQKHAYNPGCDPVARGSTPQKEPYNALEPKIPIPHLSKPMPSPPPPF